jgi:hypothetical protein
LETDKDAREVFVCQMMPRLDYPAFRNAASNIDPEQSADLPSDLPPEWQKDANFLQKVIFLAR